MKTRLSIISPAVVALAALAFFGCTELLPVSITGRISSFVDSLNGSRSDTYANLDPSTAAYTGTQLASWWDSPFGVADEPYTYTPASPDTTTPTDVEVTIKGANGFSKLYKFVMVNVGTVVDSWLISDIQVSTGTGTWASLFTAF